MEFSSVSVSFNYVYERKMYLVFFLSIEMYSWRKPVLFFWYFSPTFSLNHFCISFCLNPLNVLARGLDGWKELRIPNFIFFKCFTNISILYEQDPRVKFFNCFALIIFRVGVLSMLETSKYPVQHYLGLMIYLITLSC